MRKRTPQPAEKGSKHYKKNWTKTWDANVHYRHNAIGDISFATRTYNKGARHYRVLQHATLPPHAGRQWQRKTKQRTCLKSATSRL